VAHPGRCLGVLLAGGAARRFGGRPKGLATIDGVRIADRVLGALRDATEDQLIVANDPAALTWFPGERVVADSTPGVGPLMGLATALGAADGAAVLVAAWDMPFVTGALLRALRERGERAGAAAAPMHGAARWVEPLCAYYPADALTACRTLLDDGERRAAALLEVLPGVITMDDEALASFGDPARLFDSVDSPEDLAALGGDFGSG
jgi:molybdopterin-guanine dinucleotide biosynthesis protein A